LQGPWELKMRAMTQRVYIDDIEAEDDAVVGMIMTRLLVFIQISHSLAKIMLAKIIICNYYLTRFCAHHSKMHASSRTFIIVSPYFGFRPMHSSFTRCL
jgi:hypothetical protein